MSGGVAQCETKFKRSVPMQIRHLALSAGQISRPSNVGIRKLSRSLRTKRVPGWLPTPGAAKSKKTKSKKAKPKKAKPQKAKS